MLKFSNFSDTNSEENVVPIFDIASNNESDQEDSNELAVNESPIDTPTLHNGNEGLRISPLKLCRAWENFHVSIEGCF